MRWKLESAFKNMKSNGFNLEQINLQGQARSRLLDLCLAETGIHFKVVVKENIAIDPRDDPNPRTEIEVVSRW